MTVVLTNEGEEWAAGRLAGTVNERGLYVGWGTGSGTAEKDDETLFTEASEGRATGSVSLAGSGVSAKYQVVATLTSDGTKTITNAGNFTATTSGTLIIHGDFEGIDLTEDDQITFTITLDPS